METMDPKEFAEKLERERPDLGYRGTGRTTAELLKFPPEGGIFVVPNGGMQHHAMMLIHKHRPDLLPNKIKVIAVEHVSDADRLRGMSDTYIVADHYFFEIAKFATLALVVDAIRRSNDQRSRKNA